MLDLGKENMATPYGLSCWHWILFTLMVHFGTHSKKGVMYYSFWNFGTDLVVKDTDSMSNVTNWVLEVTDWKIEVSKFLYLSM